jgi:hypothetical protein
VDANTANTLETSLAPRYFRDLLSDIR